MRCHPIAQHFPMMEEEELAALTADIRENGLLEPIVLYEDKILDGRNRYRACKAAGVDPRFEEWAGTSSPEAFVISKNLIRRHLNESQRAMIAARISTQSHGQRADYQRQKADVDKSTSAFSVPDAAKMLNVSDDIVRDARQVLAKASPEQISAIDRGEARVSPTAKKLRNGEPSKFTPKTHGVRDKNKPYDPQTKGQIARAEAQKDRLVKSISTVRGFCRALEQIDMHMAFSVCSKDEIKHWRGEVREVTKILRRIATKLEKGVAHGR